MTSLLNEQVIGQIQEAFNDLKSPVNVMFFGTQELCQYCADTEQLLAEITSISDLLKLSVFDIDDDATVAKNYNVELAPGIVIAGESEDGPVDYGVRYAGIPSGYEFSAFIQDLLMVSGGDSGLQDQTRKFLAELDEPVHLQVFATPT
jgi:glutaredoxin-like protein